MRIAIIIEDVNRRAGQERVLAELLWRLVPRHEVHLFCYEAEDIPPEVVVHRLRRPPVKSFMAGALWIVVRSLLAVNPRRFDVVLSQGGNALNQTHTLVHACQAQRWQLTREVYWPLAPPSLPERLLRTFWYRVTAGLEGRAVRRCSPGGVLAVSAELANQLSRYHRVPRESILVCENGVDHERFQPDPTSPRRAALRRELGLGEDDVLALFLGGLWLEKGAWYSVQALPHCPPTLHLCLAGRDDPAPFRRLAESLGVADRLHFLPPTDRPWEYYQAADLFLFPGHSEGFGLVAAEAAACGLPVLMARIGVAEQLIEEGVSGFLVDHDPLQIADRLSELVTDPQRRRRMGERAHVAALRFTWERQAAEIEAALEAGRRR